ncbi:helix-turn-helix domain-containing protein [Paenibacillus sedimenti]|uniref:Helix-turn-helix transcriptional regulator n=1 Tax=Paenibacillus sedimenti TaxID=2770274 RepID=A0A926KQX8_9BACL|nr:helix-turn-helix transcriptional regulator [Paenibacillus sedimenti]MBD0382442.1 helix-turn-helix transcriptional regulator [Paenibacillus sedimenti]
MQDLQKNPGRVIYSTNALSVIHRFANIHLLTNREAEIISLIALKGYSNKEIAQHCTISEKTVKVHIDKIMDKVGTRSMRKLLALIINTTV